MHLFGLCDVCILSVFSRPCPCILLVYDEFARVYPRLLNLLKKFCFQGYSSTVMLLDIIYLPVLLPFFTNKLRFSWVIFNPALCCISGWTNYVTNTHSNRIRWKLFGISCLHDKQAAITSKLSRGHLQWPQNIFASNRNAISFVQVAFKWWIKSLQKKLLAGHPPSP